MAREYGRKDSGFILDERIAAPSVHLPAVNHHRIGHRRRGNSKDRRATPTSVCFLGRQERSSHLRDRVRWFSAKKVTVRLEGERGREGVDGIARAQAVAAVRQAL